MNTTKKLYTILALVTGILLNLSSCKNDDDSPDEPKQITLTAELPLELEAGQTVKLKFAIKADSSEVEIHWKSSNEEVVSVQQDGTVTAALAGTADITASSSNDGVKTQVLYHVTVKEKSKVPEPEIKAHPESVPSVKAKVKPEQIMLTYKGLTIELDPGQTVKLQAYVSPEGAEQKVTYQSSDEKVAAVTQEGTITAVAAGEAEITATSQSDKEVKAVCKVVVKVKKSEKAEPSTTLVDIPDENFRAYLKQEIPDAFPGGGDKMDSSSELVKHLKKIIVENKEIKSMKGIEYFTGLEELRLKSNKQLTELDVSHNKELRYLDLAYVPIKSLDVTQNKELIKLYVSFNNTLETLDVSQNTKLENLFCYGESSEDPEVLRKGKLAKLDVSHNTALKKLICRYNKLTTLDVTHNRNLENLDCSGNPITELDVSQNKALRHLECQGASTKGKLRYETEKLKVYESIGHGKLTKIDVTHNPNLITLECQLNQIKEVDVTHNPYLIALQCQFNQIKEVDVTHNTALTSLYCVKNNLTQLDVTKNLDLKRLYFSDNQIRKIDVTSNLHLQMLYAARTLLTELDVKQNRALQTLDIRGTKIKSLNLCNNHNIRGLYYDSGVIIEDCKS